MTNYGIVIKDLLKLEEKIEANDKKGFIKIFEDCRVRLNNCSCGDAYLKQAIEKVYAKALNKFILN